MGKLSSDDRKTIGKRANEVRDLLESTYSEREKTLKDVVLNKKLESERIDVTLPGVKNTQGSIHPIAKVTSEICDIFARLGFSVRQGPHIERDFYNFDALNIPPDHSSRDLQDTFYVKDGVNRKPGEVSNSYSSH
jgi:phenylalanyl-tRNA synthetase alpha chain